VLLLRGYLTNNTLKNTVNRPIYRVINMITANDLKTKGIACLEESLANQPEAVITVRGPATWTSPRKPSMTARFLWPISSGLE
jgi:hypothetical protein